jgi:hypothetical protein
MGYIAELVRAPFSIASFWMLVSRSRDRVRNTELTERVLDRQFRRKVSHIAEVLRLEYGPIGDSFSPTRLAIPVRPAWTKQIADGNMYAAGQPALFPRASAPYDRKSTELVLRVATSKVHLPPAHKRP